MTDWINKDTRTFMSRGYLREGQSVEDRIHEIADAAGKYLGSAFSKEFEEQLSAGWFSLASPIWSNYGTNRGLPISCNGSYIDDSIEDILGKVMEIGIQSKWGAGTSIYAGAVRPRGTPISTGGLADGPTYYAKLAENQKLTKIVQNPDIYYDITDVLAELEGTTNIISQSNVRRGSCAIYLDIEHPDIVEFLGIRDRGNPIQNLSFGVCIGDQWMEEMLAGDKDKRKLWLRIVQKRCETGYPYLFFKDHANNYKPEVFKDYPIYASNLCTEIMQPSSVDMSFVCCLASMNILKYDEWKNTNAVQNLVRFLSECVMEEYIEKTYGLVGMETANFSARTFRSIGVGSLGWHSYLQSKHIAFDSLEAQMLNIEIHKLIHDEAYKASEKLVQDGYEPVAGTVRRNAVLLAVAPTTSSSFILGQVSPSVEPLNSNYFVKDLAKGKFTYRNPYLEAYLIKIGYNTPDVWRSILEHGGSVQHLEWLDDTAKEVFKTFEETNQYAVIQQAADRQQYIDQGQSINLLIPSAAPAKDVHNLLVNAWKLKLKSLYYQRSTNPIQEYNRSLLECSVCEA